MCRCCNKVRADIAYNLFQIRMTKPPINLKGKVFGVKAICSCEKIIKYLCQAKNYFLVSDYFVSSGISSIFVILNLECRFTSSARMCLQWKTNSTNACIIQLANTVPVPTTAALDVTYHLKYSITIYYTAKQRLGFALFVFFVAHAFPTANEADC